MQGSELKDARKALGMTQAELANALGLSNAFIGMMERGEKAVEKRTELAVRYLYSQAMLKTIIGGLAIEIEKRKKEPQDRAVLERLEHLFPMLEEMSPDAWP
jgi:transcriptional regulator with XRE-family HTH domain